MQPARAASNAAAGCAICARKTDHRKVIRTELEHPWRDSNSRFRLRRPTLYPLSYRGERRDSIIGRQAPLPPAGRGPTQYCASRLRISSVKYVDRPTSRSLDGSMSASVSSGVCALSSEPSHERDSVVALRPPNIDTTGRS